MPKTNNSINIKKYLHCSKCGGEVKTNNKTVECVLCHKCYPMIDGSIPDMTIDVSSETEISLKKWDELYSNKKYLADLEKDYKIHFLGNILEQLIEYIPKTKNGETFLEIGSGSAIVGEQFAKEGYFFIGIDFSISALRYLKSRLDKNGIKNYLLVRGDIQNMPIRNNVINAIYGGGVIEHFKNTQVVINHLYRILKKGGVSFNSVPVFNIGNLIYRSRWGGIPNVPILKQITEFIHVKLLKSRYMVFGYELQFTQEQLRQLHINAGFLPQKIHISRFRCEVQLNGIVNKKLRSFLIGLCDNNKNFWPGVKVVSFK